VAIADRYAAWGQLELAIEQLHNCGGIEVATLDFVDHSQFATREHVERAFEASQSK